MADTWVSFPSSRRTMGEGCGQGDESKWVLNTRSFLDLDEQVSDLDRLAAPWPSLRPAPGKRRRVAVPLFRRLTHRRARAGGVKTATEGDLLGGLEAAFSSER